MSPLQYNAMVLSVTLSFFSFSVNPFIYASRYEVFRRYLKQILNSVVSWLFTVCPLLRVPVGLAGCDRHECCRRRLLTWIEWSDVRTVIVMTLSPCVPAAGEGRNVTSPSSFSDVLLMNDWRLSCAVSTCIVAGCNVNVSWSSSVDRRGLQT